MDANQFNVKLINSWEEIKKKITTDQTFINAGKGKIKAYENFWFFLNSDEIPGLEIKTDSKIKVDQRKIFDSNAWRIDLDENIFRMTLKKREYSDFFKKIVNLVLTKIYLHGFDSNKSVSSFLEYLSEAKSFFEDDKKLFHLSKESEVGLIGELIVLKEYFLKKYSYEDSLKYWTGPYKKHDFETNDSLLEIKTSTSSARIVRTSSNDQLSPIFEKKLYLVFVQIISNLNGKTLNDYANELLNLFKGYSELLFNDLLLKLTKSGYHHEHYEKYNEKYEKNSLTFYAIKKDFPHIKYIETPKEITELNINYKLDLNLCERFIIKETDLNL